jgi:hypothetical protein
VQVRTLLLVATAAAVFAFPAAAAARYEGKATSVHPGAIDDASRNWTYLGDTLRVSFRNTSLAPGQTQRYQVCFTKNTTLDCRTRTLRGARWDSWSVRVMPPWAGYVNGRYVRYVAFTWRVGGRIVAMHRAWVYE